MNLNPIIAVKTRISAKILTISLFAMLLTGAVGAVAAWQIQNVADKGEEIYTQALVPGQEVARLRQAASQAASEATIAITAFLRGDLQLAPVFVTRLEEANALVDETYASYSARDLPPAEREAIERFGTNWTAHRGTTDMALQMVQEGRVDELVAAAEQAGDIAEFDAAFVAASEALDDLANASATTASLQLEEAEDAAGQAMLLMGLAVVIGLVVTVGGGVLVARSIVRPLQRLRSVLVAVAGGDLTKRADVRSSDEVGEMAAALNSTLSNVLDVVRQIDRDAGQLSTFAGAVSAQSASASQRAGALTRELSEARLRSEALGKRVGELAVMSRGKAGPDRPSDELFAVMDDVVATSRELQESIARLDELDHGEAGAESMVGARQTAEELAEMAENLNIMIALFALEDTAETSPV
jgi:methyl-accepting chemotaxis protein